MGLGPSQSAAFDYGKISTIEKRYKLKLPVLFYAYYIINVILLFGNLFLSAAAADCI